jgi:hypothetical protein
MSQRKSLADHKRRRYRYCSGYLTEALRGEVFALRDQQLCDDTNIIHPQIFHDPTCYHGPLIPADLRDQT